MIQAMDAAEPKLTKLQTVRAVGASIRFAMQSSPQLLVFIAITELIGRAVPFINAWLVSQLIILLPKLLNTPSAKAEAVRAVLYIALFTLAPTIIDTFTNGYLDRQKVELELKIERRLKLAFANLPFALYEDKQVMDSYQRASRFSNRLSNFVLYRLRSIFGTLVTLVIAAIAFWHFSPLLTLGIFVLTFPALWVELRMQKLREQTWRQNTVLYRKVYAYDTIIEPRIIKESRLLGLARMAIDRGQHHKQIADLSEIAVNQTANKYRTASLGLEAIIEITVLLRAINQIAAGKLPVGQFVFIQQLITQYLGALREGSGLVQDLDDLLFGVNDYTTIIDTPREPAGKPVANINQDITIQSLSFQYPGSTRRVLRDVSLTIPAGKTIAIVGENGAGKTTLIKLLMRLYNPAQGSISIGTQPLSEISSQTWHRHLGALFQDFQLFYDFTLRENIWFGNISASAKGKQLDRSVAQADAADFISELPNGLDTYLGKYLDETNGTDLSGGQAQRLAIARTLFRQSDILILDEPTSAIDAKAEYEIFKNIEQARAGRTTILISHRFSTVRRADYIYVLAKGTVHEHGTHEQLLAQHGMYYEMFTKQAEGYR